MINPNTPSLHDNPSDDDPNAREIYRRAMNWSNERPESWSFVAPLGRYQTNFWSDRRFGLAMVQFNADGRKLIIGYQEVAHNAIDGYIMAIRWLGDDPTDEEIVELMLLLP